MTPDAQRDILSAIADGLKITGSTALFVQPTNYNYYTICVGSDKAKRTAKKHRASFFNAWVEDGDLLLRLTPSLSWEEGTGPPNPGVNPPTTRRVSLADPDCIDKVQEFVYFCCDRWSQLERWALDVDNFRSLDIIGVICRES